MRIFLINTDYTEFIDQDYKSNHGLAEKSFADQLQHRYDTLYGVANFYSKNLNQLGHEAVDIIVNHRYIQSQWAKEHGLKIKNWNQAALEKITLAQIEVFKPDVIYSYAMETIGSDFLNRAKKLTAAKVVGQHAASITPGMDDLSAYDLFISSLPSYVKSFKRFGLKTRYLQLGFEQTVLDKIKPANNRSGVIFIGGLSGVHSQAIEPIEKLAAAFPAEFKSWGYGAEGLPAGSALRQSYQGSGLFGRLMYQQLGKSLISVNRHSEIAGKYANNMRLYETTGMGSLLITDHKKNLKKIFKPGQEVIVYKSADDLIEKAGYYLANPAAARQIAQAGQKRTLKDHTYQKRMEQLIGILESDL